MSSDTISISISGIGKRYTIGRERRERYTALRDVIARSFASAIKKMTFRPEAKNRTEEFWALKNVSFTVKQGERLGIIGRNGAGKSTLLKILSRITSPTEGDIVLRGRVASLLEVGTGFHPELTGRENIFLNGAILGMNRLEIKSKFDDIVEFSEISNFLDTPVKRYSSGMYVRLAFAVAAHLEPEILLVDEVLAVGDLSFQNKCMNKMQDVAGSGRTVIFVSHNMGAIHSLCPRCVLLDKGRLIQDGPTNEVIETYVAKGIQQGPEITIEPNPEKPACLRRVAVVKSDNVVCGELRYDQEFKIVMEFDVLRPLNDCSVWFDIRTLEGTIVFGTADTDLNKALLGWRSPGHYRAEINLPSKWLNTGRYSIVCGIARLSTMIGYDRIEASTFSILEIGTPELGRPGILQPFFIWDEKQC
jgi:lipopolysaccharide transport system ATP-binding protein